MTQRGIRRECRPPSTFLSPPFPRPFFAGSLRHFPFVRRKQEHGVVQVSIHVQKEPGALHTHGHTQRLLRLSQGGAEHGSQVDPMKPTLKQPGSNI